MRAERAKKAARREIAAKNRINSAEITRLHEECRVFQRPASRIVDEKRYWHLLGTFEFVLIQADFGE